MGSKPNHRKTSFRLLFFLTTFLFVITVNTYSQSYFKGRIISDDDEKPVQFASVGIKGKKAGGLSDTSGHFSFLMPSFVKGADTIIISSIGFESIRTIVSSVLGQSEFRLKRQIKTLPDITIISFLNSLSFASSYQTPTIFVAWYEYKTGGELGCILHLPYEKYKFEKISFLVDNKCDTCRIRLHIRNLINDKPGDELLKENIILPVVSKTVIDDPSVFDLSNYDVVLSNHDIYIGFEVLQCSCKSEKNYSISFGGTEYGEFEYKSFADSPWERRTYNGLYMKIALKY